MKTTLLTSLALVACSLLGTSTVHAADVITRKAGETFHDCPDCPAMVVIPAGHFERGSTVVDAQGQGDEAPRHEVRFARPFAVGQFEVTRAQYARFVKDAHRDAAAGCNDLVNEEWTLRPDFSWSNPGYSQADEEPVTCVNWNEARAYVTWLATKTGKTYRLLSEAEWEYVARAGDHSIELSKAFSHEDANYGREECCAGLVAGRDRWLTTAPVGQFPANRFGVHDALGNVWEWAEDCYHTSYEGAPSDGRARVDQCSNADRRIVRGGGWRDGRAMLRPGYRLRAAPDARYVTLGFRVARDLP
jgi:formylglycine-generating enzyme required for sulfatase activity